MARHGDHRHGRHIHESLPQTRDLWRRGIRECARDRWKAQQLGLADDLVRATRSRLGLAQHVVDVAVDTASCRRPMTLREPRCDDHTYRRTGERTCWQAAHFGKSRAGDEVPELLSGSEKA